MQKNFWFRAKKYGWGWGLPRTWQGWVVLTLYLLVVVYLEILLAFNGPDQLPFFFAAMFVATLAFVIVCMATGETPHWSWGDKKRKK